MILAYSLEHISALIFCILTGIVISFQAGLALGFPWGVAAMGGKFPGKWPPKMRLVAVINMLLLGCFIPLVLSRAGLLFSALYPIASPGIWFLVVFFALGTVMNSITPSKAERIWAPVAFFQFLTTLVIALS
ncbi:hypothetical protein [Algoriphagus confluentis]|uniref:Uncharacterized protein n=1 Tax=Algoriphagus confluentis TaxID=1697556 RepID=A0ABQ6PRT0_9BACT|nr:hypothetical protein Aconfl_33270 [Algoriphagus confluentis]